MKAAPQTEYRATFREYVEVIYELEEAEIDTIQARVADWLGVAKSAVTLVGGSTARVKSLAIAGDGAVLAARCAHRLGLQD